MGRLTRKIAFVTGGNSGIGLATAKRFVAEGAYVYITGRRKAELETAAREIGENVTALQGDVANLGDLDRWYETVKRDHDHIDVLFANAGGGEFARLGEIREAHFDKTFAINVRGMLFTVQKALPLLRRGASVILMASTAGSSGIEAFSVYAATKAAVRSFARSWTLDLKPRGIRVNAISPGPIETPGLSGLASTPEQAKLFKAAQEASVPLGRLGTPDEVASAVAFLASDNSSFMAGAELFVDGGARQV